MTRREKLKAAQVELSKAQMPQGAKDTLADLAEKALMPLDTDKWIYRSVVWALGLAVLACLFLTYFTVQNASDSAMPDIFLAVGSAAVGALAGLLAPSLGRSRD